ncbi:double strand break localizing Dbl1 [Schizosaccharomyces osmophilus]|uniref:Double strand break localizing Dbl1 n=1 Tax=Schizosaccharomyces osmophilus TaxID=2545709 RepID=A0AAF0AWQ3_9SCHI|nr:double strand break localizing Dbl1 [Schizosaccharomyces osmophilus]WBW74986.1 double strand break localizing Dbl1 [Schizosaccharomyces osmophilus]
MPDSPKSDQPCVSWKLSPLKSKSLSDEQISQLFTKSSGESNPVINDPVVNLWDRLQQNQVVYRSVSMPSSTTSNKSVSTDNSRNNLKRSRTLDLNSDENPEPKNKLSRVSNLVSLLRATIDRREEQRKKNIEEKYIHPDFNDQSYNDEEPSDIDRESSNSQDSGTENTQTQQTLDEGVPNDATNDSILNDEDDDGDDFFVDDEDLQRLQDIENKWVTSQPAPSTQDKTQVQDNFVDPS